MKHIFVVNPAAGNGSVPGKVRSLVGGRPDCEIYETKGPGDATAYIRSRCAAAPLEEVCYVACGGDGTLNEVASGLAENPRVCMTVLPLGSGNDFVKAFGGAEAFLDLEALLAAQPRPIDILRVGTRWAVNAFHFGLDSYVAKTMAEVKRKPVIGGKNAYSYSVLKALFHGMRHNCTMQVDGEAFYAGDMLLCTVANGTHVGGSYYCAPRSKQDDGLAEVCMVRTVPRTRFITLAGTYQNGKHLTDPRFRDIMQYRRGKHITVDAGPGFYVSLDGEIVEGTHFDVEVVPGGVRFAAAGSRVPVTVG